MNLAKMDRQLRLEESDRPGYFFIGGRRYGRACRLAYDWCSTEPVEQRSPSAVALSMAVHALCSLVGHLHRNSRPFDNRFNNSIAKYVASFERHFNLASTLP